MSRLKYLGREIKRNTSAYLFLLPWSILFFTFTLAPVAISLFYGFTYYNILEPARWIGFDNYINMLTIDNVFPLAMKNTFVLAAVTGPVGYISSFLFAWFISELRPKLRAIMVVIFYAPSISGAVYLIWKIVFDSDAYGYLNGFLMKLGFINDPIDWLTNPDYMMAVVIIVSLWMSLGAGFLSFVAGLQNMDRSQFEAGYVDGITNRWQELWFITLPSMRPQLMFGAVMSISSAFSVGGITTALCGFPSTDYAVHTLVNHISDYGGTRFEMGYACALATLLFLMMIVANRAIQVLLSKVGS